MRCLGESEASGRLGWDERRWLEQEKTARREQMFARWQGSLGGRRRTRPVLAVRWSEEHGPTGVPFS